jgi:chemotaxis protein histidine kinase CheA
MLTFFEPVIVGIEKVSNNFRSPLNKIEQPTHPSTKKQDDGKQSIDNSNKNIDISSNKKQEEEEDKKEKTITPIKEEEAKVDTVLQKEEKKKEKKSKKNETAVKQEEKNNEKITEKPKEKEAITTPSPSSKQDTKVESATTEKNTKPVPTTNKKKKKMMSPTIGAVLVDDLLGDLENLSREELLYRLNNLSHDMKEHAKWEALRQHDVWRRAEMETWNKYSEIVQEQQDELISRHEKAVMEACNRLEAEKAAALNERELVIAAEDASALKEETKRIEEYFTLLKQAQEDNIIAETANRRAELQVAANEERLRSAESRLQSLDELSQKMSSLKSSFEHQDLIKKEALEAHRQASNTLLGYSKATAPLVPQLQQDFKTVFAAGVKASMIPRGLEESGFGQLIGSVLGTVLLFAPEIPPSSVDGSTQMIIGARNAVQAGDIKAAIQSLDQLQGPARLVVSDWVRDAQLRVSSDEALVNLAHTQK